MTVEDLTSRMSLEEFAMWEEWWKIKSKMEERAMKLAQRKAKGGRASRKF